MFRNMLLWAALIVAVPLAGLIVGMLAFRVHGWVVAEPALADGDFAQIVQHVGAPVVLVSTSTCPWCAKARDWLDAAGVDYRDCITDADPEARALFDELGIQSVPLLLSASQRAVGFDVPAFETVVRSALAAQPDGVQRCNAPRTFSKPPSGLVPAG